MSKIFIVSIFGKVQNFFLDLIIDKIICKHKKFFGIIFILVLIICACIAFLSINRWYRHLIQ